MFLPVIPAGTDAPGFELPGLIDGAHRPIALEEFLGEDVVILAFYPADFNPACDTDSDLDELDLFTMQKDVEVLAIGPDTLYSHGAFADEYDLHVPLLSDTGHEVAETYGVAFEDGVGQRLAERAVFVIDHDGVIQYAWSTQDMEELPNSEEIRDAIADTGGDDTAFARYRVGHAHYTEGRRAFTAAMGSYRDSEWMVAQSDFKRAREEFEEAADHFDSSARFADDETFGVYYERAQEKTTALWQAADWLGKSASEYSSGRGAEGQRLRDDAEKPLENARDLGEPIDPDEWPPGEDGDERESFLPRDEAKESALTVDIDDEVAENGVDDADDGGATDLESGDDVSQPTDDEDAIDDAELEEIEAELTASQPENPEGEELEETPTSMVDAPPGVSESPNDASGVDHDDGEENDGGDEIDDDLKELEAEMEASQAAAEAASQADAAEQADGDEQVPDDRIPDDEFEGAGDVAGDELAGASDDETSDERLGESPGERQTDPHADPAKSGSSVPGASRSLEPAGEPDADDSGQQAPDGNSGDAADDAVEGDGEDEVVLDDEPQGASDEDLADIPTAEDLAENEAEGEEAGDGRGGGGH